MKFDFIIGNPPYQNDSTANSRMSPIYHRFMDACFEISNKVELITPARFLFRQGQTPKEWNEKMLNDSHFKVLSYFKDASRVFPYTEIKGGVSIIYYDNTQDFVPIKLFTTNDTIKSIANKITEKDFIPLSSIISNRGMYRFSDKFFEDEPSRAERISAGTGNMITSNIFDIFPEVFMTQPSQNTIPIYGRMQNRRVMRFIRKDYLQTNDFIDNFNIIVPEANGEGLPGEKLSMLEILEPGIAHTDTFLSIGKFQTPLEAKNCLKYIKSKFARTALGILKTTQHNPPSTWKYVPFQDFTENSEIDWSKSIPEIDRQLYAKYGLDEKEIEFIETHVKEMN